MQFKFKYFLKSKLPS